MAQLPAHLSEMARYGLHTGCRQGEITGLQWQWLREKNGIRYVALPGDKTKNGESRPVVLNRIAAAIVDACHGRHPTHVFTYQPRGDRPRHPIERLRNTAWQRAREAAGLPGLQVHDLRRTFGSRLRDNGVPIWTVSACLGHKSGDVTELYALPTLQELQAAVKMLETTASATLSAIYVRQNSGRLNSSRSKRSRKRLIMLVATGGLEPPTSAL